MIPAISSWAFADDLDGNPDAACKQIKLALHALAAAEHDEAFALDLASAGGSTAAVQARLSDLVERSQDLRIALRRVRLSKIAKDPRVEQCARMGYHALVTAEKLSSDVESVLFGGDDSFAEELPPLIKSDASAPALRRSAPP